MAITTAPARADDSAQFYAGKTIAFMVGYGAGGSYDTAARLLSRHWGRHIPGKPSIVVQIMTGAGGITLLNHLYNAAAKDGTVVGISGRGLYLEALFGSPAVKYDPLQFNWIGSHAREVSALVVSAKAPFKTVADIMADEIIIGTSSPGADTYSYAAILKNIVGAKVKMVTGFQAQADAFLAMDRGEVHANAGATIGTLMSLRPQWLKEKGHVTFIVQLSTERHPTFYKDVPLVMELAKTEVDRQALALAFSRQKIAYAFAAPPGVPANRVAALRASFMALANDPEFLAETQKVSQDVSFVEGADVTEVIRQAFAMPKAVIERAKSAISVPK